jgi:small-conductance mechanosensitive channel
MNGAITSGRALVIFMSALVLISCIIGSYLTRDSMANLHFATGRGTHSPEGLVDQSPWTTAAALAPLAVSVEEQRYAREAQRLADHEVDQAFAMALRQASLQTHVLAGEALALSHKVEDLQRTVKDDQAQVDSLTEQAKRSNTAAVADDLEVATAQLALDADVLNDAVLVLARQSGDQRSTIQQELTAREAAMHAFDEHANSGGQTAVESARAKGTLYRRLTAWFSQRSRYDSILQAMQQADRDAVSLKAEYAQLQTSVSSATIGNTHTAVQPPANGVAPAAAPLPIPTKANKLESIKRLSAQSSILSIMADRLQTQQQLSAVYGKWAAQVVLQHRILWHLMLGSFAWIALIVLCAGLAGSLVNAVLERPSFDNRRRHTLHTILLLATQVLALLCILLVIFGPPSQVPTILGLATAGLTLAFQDFIVAFLGWFVLMGKNGIRVGDWVEINGVGGEVVEIGLFRTSLLETGNWTDRGHPTGRRVTFLNKFAISGQYFNFSTTGQWMWDEIKVNISSSKDSQEVIGLIHKAVVKETEKDTNLAKVEWQRVTQGLTQFSATPTVDMRPTASGTDIIVRYATRAADRFEMRNRLYQAVIDLLHRASSSAPDSGPASK